MIYSSQSIFMILKSCYVASLEKFRKFFISFITLHFLTFLIWNFLTDEIIVIVQHGDVWNFKSALEHEACPPLDDIEAPLVFFAAQRGFDDILELLLSRKVDVNKPSENGMTTALMAAAEAVSSQFWTVFVNSWDLRRKRINFFYSISFVILMTIVSEMHVGFFQSFVFFNSGAKLNRQA